MKGSVLVWCTRQRSSWVCVTARLSQRTEEGVLDACRLQGTANERVWERVAGVFIGGGGGG